MLGRTGWVSSVSGEEERVATQANFAEYDAEAVHIGGSGAGAVVYGETAMHFRRSPKTFVQIKTTGRCQAL